MLGMKAVHAFLFLALVMASGVVGSSVGWSENNSVLIFQRNVTLVESPAGDGRHLGSARGSDPGDCFAQLIGRHATTTGPNLVVGRARFGDGRAEVIDDETFDLLTLEIAPALLGLRISVPSPGVVVRHSLGPRYGYLSCRGSVSQGATGSLLVQPMADGSVQVEVDLLVVERDVRAPFGEETNSVKESFVARVASYSIVDPATGIALQRHPRDRE